MSRKRVNLQTCFVIMPFAKEFDRVYESVVAAVTGLGLNFPSCVRADDIHGGGHIMEVVLSNIEQSEVIVADVTGGNQNVFYELGYAHRARPVENAEFDLTVLLYAPGRPDECFPEERFSLDEGGGLIVPHLNWRLILDAVSDGKAYFCLCEPVKDGSRRTRPGRG